jgi:hypothetical protein
VYFINACPPLSGILNFVPLPPAPRPQQNNKNVVQVGKATLCSALAESLFGSQRHLLRLNLAEFGDKASVSRLVGAPPGYVGFGEGGLLTDAVR